MQDILEPDDHIDKKNDLLGRFQKQLNKVEQLMNASIRPFLHQEPALGGEVSRQALETLERWSELYRHGLEASGTIAEHGAEWLRVANQRLSLTVEELQRLDTRNEALATKKRADKARYLLETMGKIKHLIIPIADKVKTPVVDSTLSVAY